MHCRAMPGVASLAALLFAGAAHADDPPPVQAPAATVRAETDEEARTVRDETPGQVTVVDARAERDRGKDLPAMIDAAPGVDVRRTGGRGSSALTSIRGSSPAQVVVLVDGVPVDPASLGRTDLSEWSAEGVERVEISRGWAPPRFGNGALGGAVNIVLAPPPPGGLTEVSATLGTYLPGSTATAAHALTMDAERRLSVLEARGDAKQSWLVLGSYADGEGDYVYFDDNGTELEDGDDRFRRRTNNDNRSVEMQARYRSEGSSSAVRAAASYLHREAGVSGIGAFATQAVRSRVDRASTDVGVELEPARSGPRARLGLSGLFTRRGLDDPLGEMWGASRMSEAWDASGDLHGGLTTLVGGAGLLEVDAGARQEAHLPEADGLALPSHDRRSAWAAALLDVGIDREAAWVLTGAFRLEASADRALGATGTDGAGASRVFASPRAGLRGCLFPWLELLGNVGVYGRAPSFLELYGDEAALAGSPGLKDEIGANMDAGMRARGEVGPFTKLSLGATGFRSDVENLIQFVPNSQVTYVAQNIGEARTWGAEGEAELDLFPLGPRAGMELDLAYTFMDARNLTRMGAWRGKRLPGRSEHQAHGALAAVLDFVRLGYEADFASGAFLDPSNLTAVPPRLLHSVFVSVAPPFAPGLTCTLAVTNLADTIVVYGPPHPGWPDVPRPVEDVAGQPLPGAAAFLTVRYTQGGDR
ncbi:MAG: TonB-dependent receptor [Deltaproteobacteria bacterium]|nr:TonB-dependent receptor [Deltaproteobacteria bacterium]